MVRDRLGNAIHEGQHVVLTGVPDELLKDLPMEDQQAIRDFVGKDVLFVAMDDYDNLELEFEDAESVNRTIWVSNNFVESKGGNQV